ncbi:hypothetical protein J6590_099158 [Homalodisca vitripennis]|nr:hypothetical protein J6590_099158 [Homalodisca vitripennis]
MPLIYRLLFLCSVCKRLGLTLHGDYDSYGFLDTDQSHATHAQNKSHISRIGCRPGHKEVSHTIQTLYINPRQLEVTRGSINLAAAAHRSDRKPNSAKFYNKTDEGCILGISPGRVVLCGYCSLPGIRQPSFGNSLLSKRRPVS